MVRELSQSRNESSNDNLVNAGLNFVESLGNAAFVRPVEGITQLVDEIRGQPHQVQAPSVGSEGGLDGFASKAGDAIGSALPFVASAVLFHRFVPSLAAESRLVNLASGFGLGATYSTLFTPVYGNTNNFWKSKLENAAVAGATVGTINSLLGGTAVSDSPLVNFGRRSFNGFTSGVAGGLVNAEGNSIINGRPLASPASLIDNGLAYGLTGALLNGAVGAMSETSDAANEKPATPELRADKVQPAGRAIQPADAGVERMPPVIGMDEATGTMVILDNGRTATFDGGQWKPGVLISNDRLLDLTSVSNPQEVDLYMKAASKALEQSAQQH